MTKKLDIHGAVITGSSCDPKRMAKRLKIVLLKELDALTAIPIDQLLEQRYKRLRSYGAYEAT